MTIDVSSIRIPIVGCLLLDCNRYFHLDLVRRFGVSVSIGIGNGVLDVPFIVLKKTFTIYSQGRKPERRLLRLTRSS